MGQEKAEELLKALAVDVVRSAELLLSLFLGLLFDFRFLFLGYAMVVQRYFR